MLCICSVLHRMTDSNAVLSYRDKMVLMTLRSISEYHLGTTVAVPEVSGSENQKIHKHLANYALHLTNQNILVITQNRFQ